MDGGTVWNINIDDAIVQCLDRGYNEADIILDMYICGAQNLTSVNATSNGYNNWQRGREISKFFSGTNSIVENMKAYPDVQYREFVQQSNGTSGLEEMSFDNATTWHLQLNSRETAKACLETGACKTDMQKLYEWSQEDQ